MKFLLIILLFISAQISFAGGINIYDAINKGIIKMNALSSGGHLGQCLNLNLVNTTNKKIELTIPAGTLFDSKTEKEQDLLVTKNASVALAPSAKKTFGLMAMCSQAHNSSPGADKTYTIISNRDSNLIKLANFISDNNYQNGMAQHAVWVFTDHNEISSIEGSDTIVRNKIVKFVCQLLKQPIPTYFVSYATDDQRAFSGKATRINLPLDYTISEKSYVTLVVQDLHHHTYLILFEDKFHKPGDYNFPVSILAKQLKPGSYFARLYVNHELKEEKEFNF